MTTTPTAEAAPHPSHALTLGWALRRALFGSLILIVVISIAAWLLHTSIDPRLERSYDAPSAKTVESAHLDK